MVWAEWILGAATLYVILGLIFAAAFVTWGVGAVDPAARSSGWGICAMIFQGVAVWWPLLAKRWLR